MTFTYVLGMVAACLTTYAFLPQAIIVIKTKNTKAISLVTYIVLNIGIILWFIYGLILGEIPIILANFVTFIFTLTILILKIKYK